MVQTISAPNAMRTIPSEFSISTLALWLVVDLMFSMKWGNFFFSFSLHLIQKYALYKLINYYPFSKSTSVFLVLLTQSHTMASQPIANIAKLMQPKIDNQNRIIFGWIIRWDWILFLSYYLNVIMKSEWDSVNAIMQSRMKSKSNRIPRIQSPSEPSAKFN